MARTECGDDLEPVELWRVNVSGRATVTCSLPRTGETWTVTLNVNGQVDDIADFPTRKAAVATTEQWRTGLTG